MAPRAPHILADLSFARLTSKSSLHAITRLNSKALLAASRYSVEADLVRTGRFVLYRRDRLHPEPAPE